MCSHFDDICLRLGDAHIPQPIFRIDWNMEQGHEVTLGLNDHYETP